ncbi:hypothetical protein AOL_s00097g250 [Orbilia oligospora ATCC 24927]|uniref:Nephrocystin 3-like N-terminal domain-containing protein n=1 Tax=Arthrobotrys oligospora (strain ATCC 24927 / CBS 115.81 / DSM 1491) TaxID=756982 RepID=G1XIS3_ARTOA|nr:hypothetical protein AOL_s00097g250 [Orbilia oligospora ATCC 24927]EGX46824.1 hypothetical protein AOL_s00097g250 [Orbilia oligospora ATCC 24927]
MGTTSIPTSTPFATCYGEAIKKFQESIKKSHPEPQKNDLWNLFFDTQASGSKEFQNLLEICSNMVSSRSGGEKGSEKAERLMEVLVEIKKGGDATVSAAPESVSLVWFGISSLISVAVKSQELRIMICDTCQSIAIMIRDCLRWERHTLCSPTAKLSADQTQGLALDKINIWEVDVPELLYAIFEFLWHSLAHRDRKFFQRIGSTVKETFTNNLKQRVGRLMDAYNKLVQSAQAQFEDLLLEKGQEAEKSLAETKRIMEESVTLLSKVFSDLHYEWKRGRLKEQTEKIAEPNSHKLHFKGLSDRANIILSERNNGQVAEWLFDDNIYQSWVGPPANLDIEKRTILCLKGRRGHGKSMAMLCLRKRLELGTNGLVSSDNSKSVVLYFFFKRGDHELQNTRTALETILYQLLNRVQNTEDNEDIIDECISILNPELRESSGVGSSGIPRYDSTDIKSICESIRIIASRLYRVYILVDALDECNDRQEGGLVQLLKSIAYSGNAAANESVRVVFSVRNTVDITAELKPFSDSFPHESCISTTPNQRVSEDLEPWIGVIEITAERNSPDLNAFLQHDVKALLTRRIDPNTHPELYNSELIRISGIILNRANGDFALARMFIAHLQQPSKLPLNEKNKPWVVWGVSGITVFEVSDHYREIYRSAKDRSWNSGPRNDANLTQTDVDSVTSPHSADTTNVSYDVVQGNPEDDPEIKNIIYHLETVGQDFFRIKKDTNLIDVDISIREWIQDEHAMTAPGVKEKRGFSRYMDDERNVVFKFTLTLRALSNQSFQDKYMPWELVTGKDYSRYEVDNWHIHLKTLDKWWISGKSHLESKWSDLREQIFIFMQPENWYRWILLVFRKRFGTPTYSCWDCEEVSLFCQHPIHIAAALGLQIVIDLLLGDNNKESKARHQERFKIVSTLTQSGAVRAGIEGFETYQKDVQNIPEVDLPMVNGSIPLYLAAPYPGALQSLIKYGANVNAASRRGRYYNGPVLLCVLSQMADHEKNMDISTWIRSAKILVSEGARVDATDDSGATALHYAAKIQDLDFFKFILISAHQNIHAVDKDLKTPLHYLFSRRPPDDKVQNVLQICDILVSMSQGGDKKIDLVNAQDAKSTSPLFEAITQGFTAGVRKLIELGVDVDDDDTTGNTFFHLLAAISTSSSTLEVAQLLDMSNLDFKRTNGRGETALMTAFRKNNMPMIEFLLEKYSSLDEDEAQPHPIFAPGEFGKNIFHYMALSKTSWDEAALKSIMSWLDTSAIRGALAGQDLNGKTPLHYAAEGFNCTQTNWFLDSKPDITVRNGDNENIFDVWCTQLVLKFDIVDEWKPIDCEILRTFKRLFDISPQPLRLSILDTLLWPCQNEKLTEILNWKLFEEYEELGNCQDEHNWRVHDILQHCQPRLHDKIKNPRKGPAIKNILSPSRMVVYYGGFAKGSEDGLSWSIPSTGAYYSDCKIHGDHPIPPDSVFYFEVTFPPVSERDRYSVCDSTSFMGIQQLRDAGGRRNVAIVEQEDKIIVETFGRIFSAETLNIRQNFPSVFNSDRGDKSEKVQNQELEITIGLGVNTSSLRLFYTFNGLFACERGYAPQQRYLPIVSLSDCRLSCTVNFGKTPFQFEPANQSDWQDDTSSFQSYFQG